jgi:hypothetical protein
MALDPWQAETFWAVYREYRNETTRVNDRYVKLLVTYADNYDAFSDQVAAGMFREYPDIEKGRRAVRPATCEVGLLSTKV